MRHMAYEYGAMLFKLNMCIYVFYIANRPNMVYGNLIWVSYDFAKLSFTLSFSNFRELKCQLLDDFRPWMKHTFLLENRSVVCSRFWQLELRSFYC